MDLGIGGRIAVVTGGDSEMGSAMAEMLLREGVKIAPPFGRLGTAPPGHFQIQLRR